MTKTADRIQQVETTRKRHGEDHYRKIGAAGGKKSTTKFNSDSGRKAVQARWAKFRAEREAKEGKEQDERQD